MSEVKLTDFTESQLQKLLNGIVWQQIGDALTREPDEDLTLLQVQILNALHFVKQRETTLKN